MHLARVVELHVAVTAPATIGANQRVNFIAIDQCERSNFLLTLCGLTGLALGIDFGTAHFALSISLRPVLTVGHRGAP